MGRAPVRSWVVCLIVGLMVIDVPSQAFGQLQWSMSFSCDSKLVASCGDRVRVFEVATGNAVADLEATPARCIAFSPTTPTLLAIGGKDGVVRLWGTNTKSSVQELRDHDGEVQSLAFSKDGRLLASAGKGRLRLWDVETAKVTQSVNDREVGLNGVSFSHDGRLLAFCRNLDKQASCVDVYQVESWILATSIRLAADKQENSPNGKATTFGVATAFDPTGKRLLISGGCCVPVSKAEAAPYDFGCRPTGLLWTAGVDTTKAQLLIDPRPGYHRSISVSPDGKRFAIGNANPAVQEKHLIELRDIDRGKPIWQSRGELYDPHDVVISPDGKLVGSCRINIFLWNADTGVLVRSINVSK